MKKGDKVKVKGPKDSAQVGKSGVVQSVAVMKDAYPQSLLKRNIRSYARAVVTHESAGRVEAVQINPNTTKIVTVKLDGEDKVRNFFEHDLA